jgi:hypothetical protein
LMPKDGPQTTCPMPVKSPWRMHCARPCDKARGWKVW